MSFLCGMVHMLHVCASPSYICIYTALFRNASVYVWIWMNTVVCVYDYHLYMGICSYINLNALTNSYCFLYIMSQMNCSL